MRIRSGPEYTSLRWINFRLVLSGQTTGSIALETRMAGNGLMPMAAQCAAHQSEAHQIVYLVVDNVAGRPGSLCRKPELERTDLETVISDLIAGHFNDPVRIVAFDSLGHWSKDVSRELAEEIQTRCDIDAMPVPEHIQDFVRSHWAPRRQSLFDLVVGMPRRSLDAGAKAAMGQ